MTDRGQDFDLTQDHIRLLRELVIVWMDEESGAPVVFAPEQYGSEDVYADVRRILGGGLDEARIDQLQGELALAFEIFLELAQLAPGSYTYPNYPAKYPDWMPRRYGEYEPMPAPVGDTITFVFTDAHLKLLHAANGGWLRHLKTLGMDGKRPYGDMTYIEIDMAAILGIPFTRDAQGTPQFTDEQTHYFDTLHTGMVFALPAFLKHGDIAPGRYHRDRAGYRGWRLANAS